MEKDLLTLTRRILEAYYIDHNECMLIEFLCQDIQLLSYENEISNYHHVCEYLTDLCQSYHSVKLDNIRFKNIVNENNISVIEGYYDIVNIQDRFIVEHCHITLVYQHHQIIYIHLSQPYQSYNDHSKGRYWDIKMLLERSSMPSVCCYLDENYTYSFVNKAFCMMLGYTEEELNHVQQRRFIDFIYKDDRKLVREQINHYLNLGNIYHVEYRIVKKDGSLIWVNGQGQSFMNEYGKKMIYSFINNITVLKTNEINLAIQKQKYQLALKDNSITILEYDVKLDRMIIDIQIESRKKIYEHYLDYIMSDRTTVFKEDRQLVCDLFLRRIEGPIEIREHIRGEDKYVRKSIDSTVIYDDQNEPIIVLATARDITTEYNHNAILEKKIQTDSLTHQLNLESGRNKIISYLASKDIKETCALMILDIDYFKTVNDNYGHLVGNSVLVDFSNCLSSIVSNKHIIIRIGGDEFMILLKGVSKEEVLMIADSICKNVSQLKFDQENLSITTSIGVCFLVENIEKCSFELMFKNADSLLYTAKKNGRNRFELSDSLDYYKHLSQKEKMSFNQLLDNLKSPLLIQEVLGLIGTYYQFNCISFISLNDIDMTYVYQNLWVSSRAYEVMKQEGKISKEDYHYLCMDDQTRIIDNRQLSLPFVNGIVKTIVSTFIDTTQKGILLMMNYDYSREFSKEELEQLHKIAYMIDIS